MKIAGFTIARNIVKNDYPFIEAVRSVLPMVDTMIILAGDSDDNTNALIESLQDPKIKVHHSVWEKSLTGGSVYALETSKAFDLIDDSYDWAFYIQADEIVHEKYHNAILESCRRYKNDKKVEGLLFKYLHFYGTYDYVGDSRKWYNYEIRIIRKDKAICPYRDAQGFRKGTKKLDVRLVNAEIYHYGWVKSPEKMMTKIKEVRKYYSPDTHNQNGKNNVAATDVFDYNDFDSLKKFEDTYPAVMQNRIKSRKWQLTLNVMQKNFTLKDRLLHWIEKTTGKRLFSFTNYRLLK